MVIVDDGQGCGGGAQGRCGEAVGYAKERHGWSGRRSTFATAAFCHYFSPTCTKIQVMREFTFTEVVRALLSFAGAPTWGDRPSSVVEVGGTCFAFVFEVE